MKTVREKRTAIVLAAGIAAVFLFFWLISHWTPVSGDDWVYAVGGKWNNPFVQAFHMYQTWSGRYLSELWGFLVAPHKHLWNILNPLFFTLILCLLIQLSGGKAHVISTAILAAVMMLCVANRLRMQTYTWIMGTTYVIPLLLFLIRTLILKRWVLENQSWKFGYPLMLVLGFCIPLYMENAAALICGADMLVLLYLFICRRSDTGRMLGLFVASAAGTLIILLSPGAALRLSGDNAAFNALSLSEKLARNWPQFLFHTYTESVWITRFMAVMFCIDAYGRKKTMGEWLLLCAAAGISIGVNHGLCWAGFTVVMIGYVLYQEMDSRQKWFRIFLILCALGANLVMMVSPIFDSRSALYTVYLWILFTLVLFEDVSLEPKKGIAVSAVLAVVLAVRMYSYYEIYHLVHLINIRRNQQIEYYRLRPDAGDAWIMAYPDESIHSPNVQEGDDTHMYYFKEYYYLDQSLHLIFYYLKDYNAETIFGQE